MDRLTQLRGGAGGSRDASLDGSSPGDSFLTANDTPSKYYSLSEDDSFDIAKDVSLATATAPPALNDDCLISNLSPIGKKDMLDYKIGKQIEAANILSGGVNIFDDNESSYDGNELVIDDNVEIDDKSPSLKSPETSDLSFPKGDDNLGESTLIQDIGGSKETEVVLQIDGKNVDAINIGNGLYLYRKEGQEELAAVQIIDDDQHQPSFKFLKVRENAEGNLEVYEEIEIEVPKEAPVKEGKPAARNTTHVPIKDISKVISDPGSSKVVDKKITLPEKEAPMVTPKKQDNESNKDLQTEAKTELNLNGKMVKISESRKSPLMAYHSTPNKEGIPLTKTMVDQKLHPSRHSDNNKKTIEVHTDSSKQKNLETPTKSKEVASPEKLIDAIEVHKPNDKELPHKNDASEITKETSLDLINIGDKTIEVIDMIEGNANNDKVDTVKVPIEPNVDDVKELVIDELKAKKPVDVEIKLSTNNKEQEKEDRGLGTRDNRIDEKEKDLDKTLKNVDIEPESTNIEISDESHKYTNEPTVTSSETQLSKHDVKESVKPLDKDIKIPEHEQPKKADDMVPAEMIELEEIDADENNLIIEEVIDYPQNMPESNKLDVEEPPSVETENVSEDQPKIVESNNKDLIKSVLPVENTEKLVEKPAIKESCKEETVASSSKQIETSVPLKDLDRKPESSNKLQSKGTKSDSSQLKDASEKIEAQLSPKDKNIQIVNTTADKNLTIIKPEIKSHIPEVTAKTSDTTSTISQAATQMIHKPEALKSKLNSMPKKPEKVETSIAKVAKPTTVPNQESSIAPTQEQSQTNVPKNTQNLVKPVILKSVMKPIVANAAEKKAEINNKSDSEKQGAADVKPKSINNNHAPVPFGKWTEANRQDFLNKIKESKVPVNMSNANQLKQANDLNRRDVLKKIDSQRQTYNASVKVQESLQKGNVKAETAFAAKTVTKPDSKVSVKTEETVVTANPISDKKSVQPELAVQKVQPEPSATVTSTTKLENQRKEIYNQDVIDKTIEGIINRAVTGKTSEDVKPTTTEEVVTETSDNKPEEDNDQPTLLDAIEMKMNELHGIPFVERPPHELPRPYATDSKASTKADAQIAPQKSSKIPNLLPLTKSQQKLKDCEDDIVNHDSTRDKKSVSSNVSSKSTEKLVPDPAKKAEAMIKKDKIITEKEFDKFVRRNSVTYENCLTVTDVHQVVQNVLPRSVPPKKISRNEQMLAEAKAKSPHKHQAVRQYPSKGATKHVPVTEVQNKTKLQMAYQTALTAKRHIESPITIIEDKPVKVVYLDANAEFLPATLDVAGRELSPAKPLDVLTTGTGDSLDSDILDAIDEIKSPDEAKTKTKHQRKQVLTPVETPDLELIEPGDLGIEVSPKKKRRIDDRPEKKNLVPKKSYLLGRSAPRGEAAGEAPAKAGPATPQPNPIAPVRSDPASAIDNLVKAAELLDNQAETLSAGDSAPPLDSPASTPVKRGRGRPRKNPLPEGSPNTSAAKAPSPLKKPRLTRDSSSDYSTDDEALIKENWTMGKINENIVCPICNKLFRSENVVFKHVKHCTGPSPSRSGSSKRSPRRSRASRDSDARARHDRHDRHDREEDDDNSPARTPRKRKSNDSTTKSTSSDEVIPLQTDLKESEKEEAKKESRKSIKPTSIPKASLVCEICGKSFRQLSYLASHKLQHKKDEPKRPAGDAPPAEKSVFSCETCKKVFRKLHHLVQHRLIHNPVPSRALRKTSSEQKDLPKTQESSKAEDQSAGFRCEPCDKSFRKLHHLVEHRETHDGINRQRSNSDTQVNPEKTTPSPQCDICKKTFRKLHHLIEHKEQHLETSSEKSDDQKSVKSSLSTKDIIHECNLCYMVFPNEHSLTKHTVICLRKKRQSAAKQAAAQEEKEKSCEDTANTAQPEERKVEVAEEPQPMETVVVEEKIEKPRDKSPTPPAKSEVLEIKDDPPAKEDQNRPPAKQTTVNTDKRLSEPKPLPEKKSSPVPQTPVSKIVSKTPEIPAKVKQVDEVIVIEDTPKKKVTPKNKVTPSLTKRQKTAAPTTNAKEKKPPTISSSDDDEVRYMFNPDFKVEETAEEKNFVKVRAKKRSSLQIERPNSKELVRRRSLLQHPPKIPRLRAKSDDTKIAMTNIPLPKQSIKPKLEKIEQVPSTDSDDSDVKYSFPKTVPEKPPQTAKEGTVTDQKKRRQTIADKRKSLGAIAKRKSLGKAVVKPQPPPAKPVKRRAEAAEHRCDCGQLFLSAALLARHASLAHTPPRVRRSRDPAPAPAPAPPATSATPKHKPVRKPSAKSDKADARRSLVTSTTKKTVKNRNREHAGVPMPDRRGRK